MHIVFRERTKLKAFAVILAEDATLPEKDLGVFFDFKQAEMISGCIIHFSHLPLPSKNDAHRSNRSLERFLSCAHTLPVPT